MTTRNWSVYEAYAAELMKRVNAPGTIVAVAEAGKPVYTKGFGYKDAEKRLAPNEQTIFGIGSITKSFTAVAIMQLQEQGKLSVTDPVVKYIPEFRFGKNGAEQGMTIHHFLTHTAGLPPLPTLNHVLVRSALKDIDSHEGPELTGRDKKKAQQFEKMARSLSPVVDTFPQLIEFIGNLDMPLLGLPGERFSYSNDCWALLGLIVTRVSGEQYEDYVAEHILKPLNMAHSSFGGYKSDNVATLYAQTRVKGKDVVYPSPVFWEAPTQAAAGFLRSTVSDLLNYMEIYRTGGTFKGERIVSQKSIDRMTTPYIRNPAGTWYGYGLAVHPNYKGISLVEHGGNIKGVSAHVSCVREKGITGACLTNFGGTPASDILLAAMNVLLGVPVRTRRFAYPKFALAPERLPRYAGTYISGEGSTIKVVPKNGKLVLEMDGSRISARPIGVDAFAIRRNGLESTVHFLCDKTGEVIALHSGSRMIPKAL